MASTPGSTTPLECPSRTLEQAAPLIELLFSVPLAIFSILSFTYGFYTLLFIASLYVLHINRHTRKQHKIFHITSTIILFLLVSGVVACRVAAEGLTLYNLWTIVLVPTLTEIPPGLEMSFRVQNAGQWLFTFTNMAAEIILIHRMFIVWGSNIKVIIIPVFLMLGNLGTGITSQFVANTVTQSVGTGTTDNSQMLVDKHTILFSGIFMGVNAFTNLMLTSLIAGRIWYISHQNSKYLSSNDRVSSSTNRKYSSIIAIILESGLLYPIFLILFIILTFGTFPMKDRLNISHASAIVSDNLALIAAIAPTLIIVRTGLGISIENNRSNTEQISKSGPLFSSSRFSAVSTFRAGAPRVGIGSSVENTTRTFDDNYNYQNRLSSLSSSGQNAFDSKRGHRVSIKSGEDYRRDSSWYQDHVEALDLEMSDFGTPTVPVPIGLARGGSEETNRDVTLNRAYHYRKSSEVLIA